MVPNPRHLVQPADECVRMLNSGRRTLVAEGHSIAKLDPPADEVGAVVVGADGDANYYKIAKAAAYLRGNPSCRFIVTNPDPAFTFAPRDDAVPATLAPAAGVWARAVAMVSGREPDIVCGKPSASLGVHMLKAYSLDPETTCMVGDRVDTDSACHFALGLIRLELLTSRHRPRPASSPPASSPLHIYRHG